MSLSKALRESVNEQATNLLVTGQRFKRFDQVRQRHFWSTYRFQPDANGFLPSGDFDLFQTPQGQSGQGYSKPLTLLETNWPGANRVADNQNLEVVELGATCTISHNNQGSETLSKVMGMYYPAIQHQVLTNTVLGITYLTNTVPLGMCDDFAQASGPHIGYYTPNTPLIFDGEVVNEGGDVVAYPSSSPMSLDYYRAFVTNGFAAPGLRRRFEIPILLQHGETFSFTLQIPPGRQPFVLPPVPAGSWEEYLSGANSLYIDLRIDMWATESFIERS